METEYEATFIKVDKNNIRKRLQKAGAKLERPEFLQKRIIFNLPKKKYSHGVWLRVRDEVDKITMSLKKSRGGKINDQKEICLTVNDFEKAKELLSAIGCDEAAYEENKRELWKLNDADITIDEWPFLEPFVEIEGQSEEQVRAVSEQLGFDYHTALFCAIGRLYKLKYGNAWDKFSSQKFTLVFDTKNPFR